MNSNHFYERCLRLFFLAFLSVMLPIFSIAQGLGQFQSAMETEGNSFRSIAAIVFDMIFVLGAIGVIYAYVTKRQDARDYLIYYAIAIVVYGILRQTYLTAS